MSSYHDDDGGGPKYTREPAFPNPTRGEAAQMGNRCAGCKETIAWDGDECLSVEVDGKMYCVSCGTKATAEAIAKEM